MDAPARGEARSRHNASGRRCAVRRARRPGLPQHQLTSAARGVRHQRGRERQGEEQASGVGHHRGKIGQSSELELPRVQGKPGRQHTLELWPLEASLGARASDSTALDGAEHPIRGGVPARRRARARHLAPARARVREPQLRRRVARGRGRRARARGAHGEFERAAHGRARALRARAPAPLGGRGRRRACALVAAAAKGGRQTGRHVGGGHSALPRHRHALREHLRRHAAAARVGHRRYGLAPHRLSVQGP